jgi:hypothetical protein
VAAELNQSAVTTEARLMHLFFSGAVEEDEMQLNLTDRDTELLRGLLQDYLPDLRREVARTEERTFRHEMVERQDMVERLIEQLSVSERRT